VIQKVIHIMHCSVELLPIGFMLNCTLKLNSAIFA